MNEYFIPTNFKIPKGYKQRFVFNASKGKMIIERAGSRTLKVSICGKAEPRFTVEGESALDWIQETIERIRFEAGR